MEIGIIGTAGRGDDLARMSRRLYLAAYAHVLGLLAEVPVAERRLRSGGAAWMDHIAVSLYLAGEAASLTLYLPDRWNPVRREYHDTGKVDWRKNPGGTSNHYHRKFAIKLGGTPGVTLRAIQQAIDAGATIDEGFGFHDRNTCVGQVDWLIALTWGPGATPKDGGTGHTWSVSPAPRKTHVPLAQLVAS